MVIHKWLLWRLMEMVTLGSLIGESYGVNRIKEILCMKLV